MWPEDDPKPDMPSCNEPPGSQVVPVAEPEPKKAKAKADDDSGDPDDLEEEIDAAEDDGDVETHHRSKPKRKR